MIIETTQKLNKKSYTLPIAMAEILLAILLYFFPDKAKIFLFGLPLVLLFGEAIELILKYLKQRGKIIYLACGIICAAAGSVIIFAGRKTFMIGIAILMLFEAVRFFVMYRRENSRFFEKIICLCASLLAFVWMILILFKGLHLYWSVREYLAMYFFGSAVLTLLHRR